MQSIVQRDLVSSNPLIKMTNLVVWEALQYLIPRAIVQPREEREANHLDRKMRKKFREGEDRLNSELWNWTMMGNWRMMRKTYTILSALTIMWITWTWADPSLSKVKYRMIIRTTLHRHHVQILLMNFWFKLSNRHYKFTTVVRN